MRRRRRSWREGTWSRLPFAIGGRGYRIMRIEGDTLAAANPFKLLADGIPTAHADMASQTLVVAGATFRDGRSGFYLLADQSDRGIAASGETLLDYQCRY
jgi:CDP-diacylglycerol pyrophosphatase